MKPRPQWPHLVTVPPIVDGFPASLIHLADPAQAIRRLEITLELIHDAGEKWTSSVGVLLRVMHAWHVVDALLDAWLELTRREQDREIEQSWWGEVPAWPQDESSEVAAA